MASPGRIGPVQSLVLAVLRVLKLLFSFDYA
jgi:hypothetical protein